MDWRFGMINFRALFFSILIFVGVVFSLSSYAESEKVIFTKQKIFINGKAILVEMAETPKQRQQGLMGRKSLSENEGMLFIFNRSQKLGFWMKNTKIPLSIGFFDKNKKLINIQKMYPPKSVMIADHQLKRYYSEQIAKYALEMNIGWFERNKVRPGDSFSFVKN